MKVGNHTIEYLRFEKIRNALRKHAATPMGEKRVVALGFHGTLEELRRELTRVGEVKELVESDNAPQMGGITDISSLLARASREGALAGEQLVVLGDCIQALSRVHSYFSSHARKLTHCLEMGNRLRDFRYLSQRIFSTVDREGNVREDATAALASLRERAQVLHQALREKLEQFLKTPAAQEALQEKYYTLREDRYVVPVKSERRGLVDGIVHAVSQTGATVFIEPGFIISHNNRLKLLQEEILREEFLILQDLTGEIGAEADNLGDSLESAGEFDLVVARALLSVELKGSEPCFTRERRVALYGARSPILSRQGKAVVPNDIIIGEPARMLVLSGPNAGGKSVALGTCGLCLLMAHAGLHIPASADSVVPFLDGLHAVPGDLEDVEEDLSTFTGHLAQLNNVLATASPDQLVLVDEIAAGTDPQQGSALGAGYLLKLAETGCLAIVATHYERLKALAMVDERFENASMELDWESLSPTYRLIRGSPGSSRTFEIARRCAVPDEILDRARLIFEGEGERFLEEAIRQLRDKEAQVDRLLEVNRRLEAEAHQLKRRRRLALEQLELQADRVIQRKVSAGMGEVDNALSQVAGLVAQLQKGEPDQHQIERVRKQLRDVRQRLKEKKEDLDGEEAGRGLGLKRAETLDVGSEVFVKKFKRKAQVLSVSDQDGTVRLKMGSMSAVLKVSEVVPLETERPSGPMRGWKRPDTAPETDRRLDMRGMMADQGLALLEKALDEALLGAHSMLVVIHGHGTGRLKAAVRNYLRETSYPVQFRPGKREEGGDGVTIVTML